MKNLIAYFLMLVTFVTGSVSIASANPSSTGKGKAANTEASAAGAAASVFAVSAFDNRIHTYSMLRGQTVEIILDGDRSTDLDLYIYDANWNLIDSSTGYSDYEILYITANASATMHVKVVNRGSVYNLYDLSVWRL